MTLTTPKYRWIEDLHKTHEREEIWVLGCGPSLDDFPDDFFDEKNRIAIAVTFSMRAFPNCTYTAFSPATPFSQNQKSHLEYILEKGRHYLYKCIVCLNSTELENKAFIGPEPIYLRSANFHLIEHHDSYGAKEEYFLSLAKNLIDGTSMPYAASGTLVHAMIQAAIVMGAKKITLAGCEAKCLKFQGHAYKRGLDKIYGLNQAPKEGFSSDFTTGTSRSLKRMRIGTAFLAKIMEPHGMIFRGK